MATGRLSVRSSERSISAHLEVRLPGEKPGKGTQMVKQVRILLLLFSVLLVSSPPLTAAEPSVLDKEVSFEFKDTPLTEALNVLCRTAGINYALAGAGFKDAKVTADLKNVSLMAAFQRVLQAVGARVETEQRTLMIKAGVPASNSTVSELARKLVEPNVQLLVELQNRTEEDPVVQKLRNEIKALEEQLAKEREAATPPPAKSAPQTISNRPESQSPSTEVYTINFIDPAELVPLIQRATGGPVSVASGGKLVVYGTEYSHKQAAELIKKLDVETALPRPVRVQIVATYTLTDKGGNKEILKGSSEGTFPEGQPFMLRVVSQPLDKNVIDSPLMLNLNLTRGLDQTGRVTLQGSMDIQAAVTDHAGGQYVVSMSSTPIALSAVTGKPTVIGAGTFGRPGGKVEFDVTATVTFGEGRLRVRTDGRPGMGAYGGYGGYGGWGGYSGYLGPSGTPVQPQPPPSGDGATRNPAPAQPPAASDAGDKASDAGEAAK